MQTFFAREWPAKIWLSTGPAIVLIQAARVADIHSWTSSNWKPELVMAICTLLLLPVGYLCSAVCAFIVLIPLNRMRCRLNGGPFSPGDSVRIIVGEHYDKIGQVKCYWLHSAAQHLQDA